MIVVIDSGVWISAFQFGGTPLITVRSLFRYHQIAICAPILVEIHRILTLKFGWPTSRVQGALDDYLDYAIHVTIPDECPHVCRDANDDMILESAVVAGAELIVSGDKDLLAVKHYKGIRVLTPKAFLNEYSEFERT